MRAEANTSPLTPPLCFTRLEFADALRVSLRTADRLIAAGEVRVVRLRGRALRILRADVERYLETEAVRRGSKNPNPNNLAGAFSSASNKTTKHTQTLR